jgi:TolB-like protein/DNA-binding winged helix-turn-helix (wHTH) protein/Tfp pilus assembly protein PilF
LQPPQDASWEIWRVGDLVVDVAQQRVMRDAEVIDLPKLSFDLLLALARRAPAVVSNEELMQQVWPGLIVSPETVVQRVKLLRTALGDSSVEPRYIAALRSRGYRLVVEARRNSGPPLISGAAAQSGTPAPASGPVAAPTVAPSQPADQARGPRPRMVAVLAAVAILALGLLLTVARRADTDDQASVTSAAIEQDAALRARRTVAVLPFKSLSVATSDQLIAAGIAEATLDRLTQVPGLIVIARDSASQAAAATPASEPSQREIGARLNAAYLLVGSLQRSGEILRITARLVESQTGVQTWSSSFDRREREVFALQVEIADRVSRVLEERIVGIRAPAIEPVPSPNFEAYLAFLRGRNRFARFSVVDSDAAAKEFTRATEIDPTFSQAYAFLYDARMQAAALRLEDLASARARYQPLLERALALDPRSGTARFARAIWAETTPERRDAEFRKALEIDSNNSRGLVAFSEFLDARSALRPGSRVLGSGIQPGPSGAGTMNAGTTANVSGRGEAAQLLERAMIVDPLSPRARFRSIQREFDSGGSVEQRMRALLEIDPLFYPALQRVAKYQWLVHAQPAEAITLAERAIAADPENPWARHTAVAFYLDLDDPAAAARIAGGTPGSARTAAPVLALFRGDVRAAAAAAASDAAFVFGFNESWGTSEALRDWALEGGDIAQSERLIRQRYDLGDAAKPRITVRNFRSAVHLAHLWLLQGREAPARELLRNVIAWIDADQRFGRVYKLRTRAEAHQLLGEQDQAMRDLAASIQVDADYVEWWYTLRRNPVWAPLRDRPLFRSLEADVAAFVERQRALLAGTKPRPAP